MVTSVQMLAVHSSSQVYDTRGDPCRGVLGRVAYTSLRNMSSDIWIMTATHKTTLNQTVNTPSFRLFNTVLA